MKGTSNVCYHPDVPISPQIKEHFLPPLLDAILLDYKRNVPSAREPEVLSTVTSIIDKVRKSCAGILCVHCVMLTRHR